jgi:hypothetical protein
MKKLVVLIIALSGSFNLHAQAVLTGSGYIDLTGSTTFTPSPSTGSRFLWLPQKSALRVGYFSTALNIQMIGQYSVAGGGDSIASAESSVAFGYSAQATGVGAIALGGDLSTATLEGASPQASGYGAIAIGRAAISSGWDSLAFGYGQADSDAFAYNGIAFGGASFSIRGNAFGPNSAAFISGQSYGHYSFAVGPWAVVDGYISVAMGRLLFVKADHAAAFGIRNIGLRKDGADPQPYSPESGDPIFEVGNGTEELPSNALTVYRDGTVRLSKAAGGISMGQFT